MAKVITVAEESETDVVGLDLSDKTGTYVVLSAGGEVVKTSKVNLTRMSLERVFGARPRAKIAIEVGGHSPWVSRVLTGLGYEVTVANPRRVKLVSRSGKLLGGSALAHIITNPFYVGMIRYKGHLYEGNHQALVSPSLFDRAGRSLRRRRR